MIRAIGGNMKSYSHPTVNIRKEIDEITIRKGEVLSTNLVNFEEDKTPHYSHVEIWVTPNGEKKLFVPEDVKIESYDNWDELFKKHFKVEGKN